MSFRHYTIDNGLPCSEVYQVLQDIDGFIWFATRLGVCRFDGKVFTHFTSEHGLMDNTIIKMYQDSKKKMWFASISGKVFYYENGVIHGLKENDQIRSKLGTGLGSFSMYVDPHGNLNMYSFRKGYVCVSKGNVKHFFISNHSPCGFTLHLKEIAPNSFYWYTAESSLACANELSVSIDFKDGTGNKQYFIPDANKLDAIKSAQRMKNGNLLISYGKVYELGEKAVPILSYYTNCAYEDRSGEIWIGTKGKGLYRINRERKDTNQYLNGLNISGLLQDKEGGLWITTTDDGVYYVANANTYTYRDNLFIGAGLSGLVSDRNATVFVSTENGNLYTFHWKNKNSIQPELITQNTYSAIHSLYFNKINDELWMGTSDYLGCFKTIESGPRLQKINIENQPLKGVSRLDGSNGDLFIPSRDGFYMSKNKKMTKHTAQPEGGFRVSAACYDASDHIIVGGMDGLYCYKTNRFLPYPSAAKTIKWRVTDLENTPSGKVIVATRGGGLYISTTDSIYSLTVKNGLLSNNVELIYLEKEAEVWVATDKGINRIIFSIAKNKELAYHIFSFTKNDGLPSNNIISLAKLNEKMWVATNKEVVFFSPEDIRLNKVPPPVIITGIKINNRDTLMRPSYQLTYDHNNIEITFSGITFKDPENKIYRYNLGTEDSTWKYTSQPVLSFSSLQPGNYNLSIEAANKIGIWSHQPSVLSFTILPPYWRTWWFTGLCFILLSGMVAWFFVYWQRRNQRKAAIEKRMIELESKALRAQMNPHFIFNALNSVQSYISINETTQAERFLADFSRLIRLILYNSRSSYISIQREIDTLKLYLQLEQLRFENKFKFSFFVSPAIQTTNVYIPPMLIQPYVENAVIHGMNGKEGEGAIEIYFQLKDNKIECIIDDNGIGRKQAGMKNSGNKVHASYGTTISKERLSLLDSSDKDPASIYFEDKMNEQDKSTGTRVIIYFNLRTNN